MVVENIFSHIFAYEPLLLGPDHDHVRDRVLLKYHERGRDTTFPLDQIHGTPVCKNKKNATVQNLRESFARRVFPWGQRESGGVSVTLAENAVFWCRVPKRFLMPAPDRRTSGGASGGPPGTVSAPNPEDLRRNYGLAPARCRHQIGGPPEVPGGPL